MSFPAMVNESELDALIDEILQSIPNCYNDPQECSSRDDTVDQFPHTKELLLSSYRLDQQRALFTNTFHNYANVSEEACTSYSNSQEQAFNDSEQAYKEAAAEEAREAMFEDALHLLSESASFQVDSAQEEAYDNPKLTNVNSPEESVNEPVLDLHNVCNGDTVSQPECESDTIVKYELNDILNYFYYTGMENISE